MMRMITDVKRRGSFLHCPLPGLTWKVSFCTWCFWKATWLPTAKREKTCKLSSVMKKTAPRYRGALVPARLFPIGRIFHIWGSERTGAALWQPTPGPEKWSTKVHRVRRHERWAFSLMCLTWRLTQPWLPDGGLKLTPVFIQSSRLWISHSVSVEKDLIHWPWGPSGSPNLQCSEVNIATVLVPSPFTVSAGPWGLSSGLIQVQWLWSEHFC